MQLPKPLQNLKKPQTLLLLGGAFGIVALAAWFGLSYRLVRNHLSQPPREAVAGFYLEGAWPKDLVASLPDRVKAVLNSSFPNGPTDAVVYASLDNDGKLIWSARQTESSGLKLIPRSSSGYGFLAYAGQKLPIELTLSQNWISARIGRGFRGLDVEANQPGERLVKSIPDGAYLYVLDKDAHQASQTIPSEIIKKNVALGDSWINLYASLGRQVETVLAYHEDPGSVFQPFLMAAEPDNLRKGSQIDQTLTQLLGELLPKSDIIKLPDQSSSIELKSGRSQISVVRKDGQYGTVTSYGAPEKPNLVSSFEDKDGHYWLSNSTLAIQGFIMAGEDSSLKFPTTCAPLTPAFQAVYYPGRDSATNTQTQWIRSWAGSMKKTIFSQNQAKTGLFTICGYYQ
jgi:hypothetical protein